MKCLLFFALTVYGTHVSAQTITATVEDRSRFLVHTIKWTSREKQGFQDGSNIIVVEKTGHKLQTGYTVRFDGTKHAMILHKLSSDGKEITVNKLEGGERVFGPIPTEPIEFGGKVLLFYFKYLDKDSMKLYVSEIEKKNLQLINTTHLFSYQQDNVGLLKLGKAGGREISLQISENKSKLLVVVPGSKEEFFTCVLDKDLQILRKKISRVAGTKDLIVSAIYIDNKGNSAVALSHETYILPTSMKSSSKEYYSATTFDNTSTKKILVQNSANAEQVTDVESWGMGYPLYNASFQVSKDQTRVYVFGNHAGPVANSGIWLSEIQSGKLNVPKPKLIAYPENFKKQMDDIGFGEKKKGEYGILSADFQMVEFDNGDLAIGGSPKRAEIVERVTVGTENYSPGRDDFYAGPVMIAFLKGKNEPVFTMIPRYQHYCDGSRSVFMPHGDKLVVLYNDVEKNINGSSDPEDVRMKGVIKVRELSLAAAILNKDGKIESRKLLAGGIAKMNYYNTTSCEFLSDRKLLIPSVSLDKKTEEQKAVVVTVE